ncbi:hypothetical protein BV25DRAFT_1825083 [Artomyces pyxidatus]|uniref:Uncharacterized protein n=1 Tax=Artomyces pyxidatus TaxID=48021 RepID=A0ACB8T2E2_9AGAM|nr:hypothetical protein BV25DRAFT_1825083 [Artomyces pyxidatus]
MRDRVGSRKPPRSPSSNYITPCLRKRCSRHGDRGSHRLGRMCPEGFVTFDIPYTSSFGGGGGAAVALGWRAGQRAPRSGFVVSGRLLQRQSYPFLGSPCVGRCLFIYGARGTSLPPAPQFGS